MIGYSEPCEHLRDAYRAHAHARLALRVAGALPDHGTPAGWEGLGAYRLLARAAETPHARELIHPGLPKLFALQSKESLVQTLEAYLDNGCDTKLTAEALFLHRASLYYRLQRIEAITGTSSQERRGPTRAALRTQARPLGGDTSGAETYQHATRPGCDAGLGCRVAVPTHDRRTAGRPSNKFGRGGGRTRAHWRGAEICAHIEWPYSAARRCLR